MFVIWFLSTVFWTTLLSFFSTQEMACISYNRLKLASSARQKDPKSIKIKFMLEHPLLLFGTTLFGVNLCLVFGSESARQAFQAIGLNPLFSSCIYIPYVLIFGELGPMFAARLFPEHMARLGIGFLWYTSALFQPLISCSLFLKRLLRKTTAIKAHSLVELDELQELLKETIDPPSEQSHMDSIAARILSLRDKQAQNYMIRIEECLVLPATRTIRQAIHDGVARDGGDYILLDNPHKKIIAVVATDDLFEKALLSEKKSIPLLDLALPVSYIMEETALATAFSQLKKEKAEIGLVVHTTGDVRGLLSPKELLEELLVYTTLPLSTAQLHIEKTVSGDEKVLEFFHKYGLSLYSLHGTLSKELLTHQELSFSDLCEYCLSHKPNRGDTIDIGPCRITVLETSIFGAKTVFIATI